MPKKKTKKKKSNGSVGGNRWDTSSLIKRFRK